MRIVKLEIENFKRLTAVSIEPGDKSTVIISGRNGAGKTSVLDAIAVALAGKQAARELTKPIRDGEEKAQVTVETEDLIITRIWTRDGTPGTLTVTSKDGRIYRSPQAFLDELIGDLSFDPLAFAESNPKDQRSALLALLDLPIDLAALDQEVEEVYSQRTAVNRRATGLKAAHNETAKPENDLPAEEVNTRELLEKYQSAVDTNSKVERLQRDMATFQANINSLKAQEAEIRNKIVRAESDLRDIRVEGSNLALCSLDALKEQVDGAENLNRAIRYAASYQQLVREWNDAEKESAALTKRLEEIASIKKKALAKADLPVPGLGITPDGITLNDIPFAQCALSEKLRVSVAIAMAANPKLRVIRITDASLLDPENMRIIEEMATSKNYQVWLEIVTKPGDRVGICIEDGAVVANATESEE